MAVVFDGEYNCVWCLMRNSDGCGVWQRIVVFIDEWLHVWCLVGIGSLYWRMVVFVVIDGKWLCLW